MAADPPAKLELKSTVKIPKLSDLKNEINAPVKEEVPLDTSIKGSFTIDQLKFYWNEFAKSLKSQKKDIEYVILINRELQLDEDHTIHVQLDNLIQVDQLNAFKADLMDYLRKNLKNNLLMLSATVAAAAEGKKLIYTSDDKLKYLAEKYPIVDELKKRLGLDTDF